jgi:hypothetical protein
VLDWESGTSDRCIRIFSAEPSIFLYIFTRTAESCMPGSSPSRMPCWDCFAILLDSASVFAPLSWWCNASFNAISRSSSLSRWWYCYFVDFQVPDISWCFTACSFPPASGSKPLITSLYLAPHDDCSTLPEQLYWWVQCVISQADLSSRFRSVVPSVLVVGSASFHQILPVPSAIVHLLVRGD